MTEDANGLISQKILAKLDKVRFGTPAAWHASRRVGDLEWRPAQVGAIALDPQRRTWHTGHVHAVVSDGHTVIVGGQTGGVWLITPIVGPTYRDGYRAVPLSDRWETTSVESLAYGPDGTQHVFAGCREADSLFLIECQVVTGAMIVKHSDLRIPLPMRTSIHEIAVIDQPRRVVIATSAGVFWSDVPVSPVAVEGYVWNEATGMPPGGSGTIVRGPGTSLAASWQKKVSEFSNTKGPTEPEQLFVGDWQDGGLVFAPASVPEVATTGVDGFVLASCLSARQRMYATAMGEDSAIRCVLRSDNGGHDWTPVAIPAGAGDHGYHNRAIAASPYRPDIVALGWDHGPFLSTDGGLHWTALTGSTGVGVDGLPCHSLAKGLHADIQALQFPLNSLQADYLVIASDGGLIVTRDLGLCFDSEYNRGLAVLQFYGPGHAPSSATLSVSSRFPGLLAGGTQDNGNITLHPDRDAGAVWHPLVGGDGGMTRFIDPIGALLHVSNGELQIRMTPWNPAAREFNGPGAVILKDGTQAGLVPAAIEVVISPGWRRNGQFMYACAGSTNGDVHGLFADADGSHAALFLIGNVGHGVAALASLTGAQVLVARTDGPIGVLDSVSGLWLEQFSDESVPTTAAVSRIEVTSPQVAYALKYGQLLRSDGQKWTAITEPRDWITFTAEQGTGRLFAATDTDIFNSTDGGQTWTDASVGLPAAPHITDMRIGDDDAGGRTLYLTTYGRSAWRATITLPPEQTNPLELPPQARAILLRIIEESGALVHIGHDLVTLEARLPVKDVLAALVIDQIAQRMSPDLGREIRRAALRQIKQAAARAIAEIG